MLCGHRWMIGERGKVAAITPSIVSAVFRILEWQAVNREDAITGIGPRTS